MQGSNPNQDFLLEDKRQSAKQSAIILNHRPKHQLTVDIHSPKKNLTSSTFMHQQEFHSPQLSANRPLKFQHDLGRNTQENKFDKSIKGELLYDKTHKEREEQYSEQINNNFIRLKVEEMAFKFKTKMATLLKEINISATDLSKYSGLIKIDDMLSFLSEKVKEKLSSTEVNQSNSMRLREREKEMVLELSQVVEGLRKKLQDKEAAQKQQKAKIKQNHNQIKSLYDQINQKQRQISIKTTQLYQLRINQQQNQKQITSIQTKYAALDKQYELLKINAQNGHKSIYSHCARLQDKEKQYQKEIRELNQVITMLSEKEAKLLNFNKGISQQVERWRERFQAQRNGQVAVGQGSEVSNKFDIRGKELLFEREGKQENKSARSYNLQQTNQLLTIIGIHEQQIKQLKNQNSCLQLYKKQYQSLVKEQEGRSQDKIKRVQNRQVLTLQTKSQLQIFYKKKMQEMSGEWRLKLIDLLDSYSLQQNKKKVKMQQVERQRREVQKKVFMLANQKYQLQCKMINRDDEIYRLNKQLQHFTSSNTQKRRESQYLQEVKSQSDRLEVIQNRKSSEAAEEEKTMKI